MTGARDEPKAFVKNAANHEVIRVHPDGSVSYAEDVTAEHLRWALEHVARQLAATRAASPVSASGGGERRFSDVASVEEKRIADTVWNYLGMRDAKSVGDWIVNARTLLKAYQARAVPPASGGAATSEPTPKIITMSNNGLPPDESPQRDAVCDALTAALLYLGNLAYAADERTIVDLRSKEHVRGLARLLTVRDADGSDGSLGENTQTLWETIGRALSARASVPRLGTELDETIPPNEVHFRQDGQTVAKITGLGTEEGR